MIVAGRRALAGLALGVVAGWGPAAGLAGAETATPVPVATATPTATPTATSPVSATAAATTGTEDATDTPDLAPDNTRNLYALGVAGVLALMAATLVFLRRR